MRRASLLVSALAAASASQAQSRPHNFDLLDVKWSVTLDEPTASLKGDVTNTLRPNKGAKSIRLDFGSLTVDSVWVDNKKAKFTHVGQALTVTLPAAPDGSKSIGVRVLYHGAPKSGAYFVPARRAFPAKTPVVYTQGEMVDNRFWLPTWDWPDDKATSEGTIDVPAGWFALSNGRLISQTTKNGRSKFHWKMDQAHVTYLISFSAGPFDEGKEEWDGIPVNYYVPKGLKDQGEAAFGGTADIVRFYSELTHFRYPYAKYTQSAVPDFMFGGMENITCTTQTITALYPKSAAGTRDALGLVAHELAHQWFGDTVTCNGWADAWINEGWASFLPTFYFREKRGQDVYDKGRYDTYQGGLGAHRGQSRGVVFSGYKDPLDMFDGFIYAGGAARMFMLMRLVGEDKFWTATGKYLDERKYTSFDTHAFFETYSKNLGMDLKSFKQQWFYTPGAPNLTVTRNGSTLKVAQAQPYFTLDVPVWTLRSGEWTKTSIQLSGAETTLEVGTDPVLVDPECWLMADINSQVAHTPEELMALFRAAPNAGEKARMMDSMLSTLSGAQTLELAREIKSPPVLRRFLSQLKEGSQSFLLDLTRGNDDVMAQGAIERLGGLSQSPDVLARLREIAEQSPNDVLRQDAMRIVLRWTNEMGLAERLWGMDSFSDGMRRIALDWWMNNHRDIARERCLEAIAKGFPEPTRQDAVRNLGSLKDKSGDRRVFNILMTVLKENSFGARNNAIGALAEYGDKAAIPALLPFTKHELVFFRRSAVGALARLGS